MLKCFECNCQATHHHHVIPLSLGGTKTIPLCDTCHPKAHGEHGSWQISELIKKSLAKKKQAGLWSGGPPPYGKQLKNGKLVNHSRQQRWVNWMIAQNKAGLTAKQIAAELNNLGVLSPKGGRWTSWRICQTIRQNTGSSPINWRSRTARGLEQDEKERKRRKRLLLRKCGATSEGA